MILHTEHAGYALRNNYWTVRLAIEIIHGTTNSATNTQQISKQQGKTTYPRAALGERKSYNIILCNIDFAKFGFLCTLCFKLSSDVEDLVIFKNTSSSDVSCMI